MSRLSSWLRVHPGLRPLALALAVTGAAALVLGLVLPGASPHLQGTSNGEGAAGPSSQASAARTSPTASARLDTATVAQASAVAAAFVGTYTSAGPGDSPDQLRSRLRPYDTDRLDQCLGQGGGPGSGAQHAAGIVRQVTVLGLAPDRRVVVVAQVAPSVKSGWAGSPQSQYVELFLVREPAGWRVDEVLA